MFRSLCENSSKTKDQVKLTCSNVGIDDIDSIIEDEEWYEVELIIIDLFISLNIDGTFDGR